MDYLLFETADFVADQKFVESVVHPSVESEAFWSAWLIQHPEKKKILHEARLLVLIIEANDYEVEGLKKELLWHSIEEKAHQPAPSSVGEIPFKKPFVVSVGVKKPWYYTRAWYKVAALITLGICVSYYAYQAKWSETLVVLNNQKGKKSEFQLPDGTKVWLNADSKLTYSSSFTADPTRAVTLVGEAFFDVTENKNKPFIVQTSSLKVKVLGTAFNVKSYGGENTIETTLVRGKVMIELNGKPGNGKAIVLTEKQQAVYSIGSKKMRLASVQTDSITAWTHGKLAFVNKSFAEIKKELERWYGIQIQVENQKNMACRFTTTIDSEPINKVLDLFKATGNITYTFSSDTTLTIKGSLCKE